MTEEDWEQLGREVANNDHLEEFNVHDGALNNQKMTSLFRGLTRSSSIDAINLYENDPGQSMIPFVQNARNLRHMYINADMTSDGFAALFRALCNSPFESLDLRGLSSLEIDSDFEIVAEDHGHGELYKTLIASVADLWTSINRKQVIIDKAKEVSDQIDSLVAKKLELESVQSDLYKELAAIEQKEADESNVCEGGVHSNKRQKMS